MKPRSLWLFMVLTLGSFALKADVADSLIRWSEVTYSSPFEQAIVRSFLKEKGQDYTRAFLANSATADEDLKFFEEKINYTVEEIRKSGMLGKRNDKKIKFIYKLVHERFLIQYEEENRFYEIIKTGKYNCVTASALYAIIFEKLNIPYAIKEEPTHVYLVAYPDQENILIETTSPLSGFFSFAPEFKASYVSTLKNQKIIGPSEATTSNTDALFNKYYFGKENITLTQLVGIHYLNDGLFRKDHDDIEGGYDQIVKGYLYYPNTRSEYLLTSFTAERLNLKGIDPVFKSTLIGRISRLSATGVSGDMVRGEFLNLTNEILAKRNDRTLHKKCFDAVLVGINDEALAMEIRYIYNYENGRIFYNQGNYSRAKPFFYKALEAQPTNVEMSSVFVSCLTQTLNNERSNRTVLDTLESYRLRFSSLLENTIFKSMLAGAYVVEAGEKFKKGNPSEGERYRNIFEAMKEADKELRISQDLVGQAYSEGATYYFGKGQKAKALQLVNRGLELAPDSYQLRVRKQMINRGN